MARGLHSNEIGAGLDEVAKFYGGQGKIDGVLETTKGVLDWSKVMYDNVAIYCAQDVDEMYRIFREMHAVYPADEINLIHMTARMFCDPVLTVDLPRVQKEYEREVKKREQTMFAAVDPTRYDIDGDLYDKELHKKLLKGPAERALTGLERNMLIVKRIVGSNERFIELLLETGISEDDIPRKISKAWMAKPVSERDDADKWSYAFAKDDLDFINLPDRVWDLFPELDPNDQADVVVAAEKSERLQLLVDVRIAVKSTTNITRAARFLEAGRDGMRLPVGYAYYRAHCLTGDAQVLTRSGWVALADWQGGDIAQWSEGGSIKFAPATPNVFEVNEPLVFAQGRYHRCVYTKGHTLPTYTSHGTFKARKAGEALTTRFDIPITGVLDGTANITPLEAQLAVMVQADGNVRSDVSRGVCVRFGFTKARKIERCKALLGQAGIEFTEAWEGDVCRIRVGAAHYAQLVQLVGPYKQFDKDLWDAPAETKEAFISELAHWDGDVEPQPNGFTYTTTDEYNAQFVSTMAHLSGRAALISTRERDHWSTAYRVYIRKDIKTRSTPKDYREVPFDGKVYCPTTKTGYFMVRQNGCIVVTGNTGRWGGNNKMNMQNLTRGGELRLSILAYKGHQIAVADSGQIEARVNGWLWDQDDLLAAFRNADTWDKSLGVARGDKRDAYCRFADDIYGREITTNDKLERFVGKVCVLGLGYQMGAAKLQMTLAKGALGGPPVYFSLDECKHIINTYRRRNYKIANGWKVCERIIEDMAAGRNGEHKCISWGMDDNGNGFVLLPNGMCLKYPDLRKAQGDKGWDEWTYQSGDMRKKIYGGLLCENLVQALARIIVATQMLWIDTKYRVVMTTHDEVVTHPKKAQASKCYDWMYRCMTTPLAWCPDIPLAAEGGFDDRYSK
jgi:DNA-binding GntR family transcriptional regulator